MYKIRKGLDLPITGRPVQRIHDAKKVTTVALIGPNYVGMKPSMLVKEGDKVKLGQPVFSCKKSEGVVYTSPAAGEVVAINRGDKRAFQSLVVKVAGNEEQVNFQNFKAKKLDTLESNEVRDLLVESGLWTALRTRPYSKVPGTNSEAHSLFITAMDTNPLTADPDIVLHGRMDDFTNGVQVLARLMGDKKVYVCTGKGSHPKLPVAANVEEKTFAGIHPAGNVGTHIHFVDPVNANKTVWHIGYQDVAAIGYLFATGRLNMERVVSLAGPFVKNPRLLRTRIGANVSELTDGELLDGPVRVVSGSVLNGDIAAGPKAYLGRYHNQISVLKEGREREFLGWQGPGWDKFSVTGAFASRVKWLQGHLFPLTTDLHGSKRAMVPIGSFEKVMPLDILPTQLLRALVTKDTDLAQQLGCLELDEEDLSLCTFVSPGKTKFGPILRENLTTIEREG